VATHARTITDTAGFVAGVRILDGVLASPTIATMSVIVVAFWLKGRLARRDASSVGGWPS